MKIRFSKVATLLLAGVALLAAGCTDYQSDVNDLYTKIENLASKESVATLENQVKVLEQALESLKTKHDADINDLKGKIAALEDADKAFTSQVNGLEAKVENLEQLKSAFETYKTATDKTLADLKAKDSALEQKIAGIETNLNTKIDNLNVLVSKEEQARKDADKALGDRMNSFDQSVANQVKRSDELQAAIDAEVKARAAADAAAEAALNGTKEDLEKAIKAEEDARVASEKVLDQRLKDAEKAREDADNMIIDFLTGEGGLQEALAAETFARISADTAIWSFNEKLAATVAELNESYEAYVATNNATVAGLKTRVEAAEAAIAANTTSIENIENTIKAINGGSLTFDDATSLTIPALSAAVKNLEACDKAQSDSLKKAFAKFDDYVLTTAFNSYKDEVALKLAAKADAAAVEANTQNINSLSLRLAALENYKKDIEKISEIGELTAVNADSVASYAARIAAMEADYASVKGEYVVISERIAAAEIAISKLESAVEGILARIQSIVFVPEYSDEHATVEMAQVVSGESTVSVLSSKSTLVYKVAPADKADDLVKFLNEHKDLVAFDVVKVKHAAKRFDAAATAAPALEILKVAKSTRTQGAIEFTVKSQNVDDYNTASVDNYNEIKNSGFDAYTATMKDFPFYASALVIDGVNAADTKISSAYSTWAPKCSTVTIGGFATESESGELAALTSVEGSVEYTNTDALHLVNAATLSVNVAGSDMTLEAAEAALAIKIPVTYAAKHEVYSDNTCVDLADKEVADLFVTDNDYADSPAYVSVPTQLDPTTTVADRRAAISSVDKVSYVATVAEKEVAKFETKVEVTKEKAAATFKQVEIKWTYANDVAVDAANFVSPGSEVYSRENVALVVDAITSETVSFADLGSVIPEVKVMAGEEEVTESVTVTPTLSEDKTALLLSAEGFEWGKLYNVEFVYSFEFCDVTISGVFKTVDRKRQALEIDFGTVTFAYEKDMEKTIAAVQTYAADADISGVASDVDAVFPVLAKIDELVAALYDIPADFAQDVLVKHSLVETEAVEGCTLAAAADNNYSTLTLAVDYKQFTKLEDVVNFAYTFTTYYGQEFNLIGTVNVTAPKYDFRHNTYFVYDNGTTKDENHPTESLQVSGRFYSNVEPAYSDGKWTTSKFDVLAIDLEKAFVVVDENMKEVDADEEGLQVTFSIVGGDELESNTDDRDNTYVTIDENKLKYHGYEDKVAVYAEMALKNSDGSTFTFPTSFDAEFESIYADKVTDGTPTTGRYANYEVVKFNPLHDFGTTQDVELKLFEAKAYSVPVLNFLTLKDQRIFDPEDPNCLAESVCVNGIELFENGSWKVGDGANGFKSGVKANDVYDIDADFAALLPDDIDKDIKDACSLAGGVFTFDYTQQIMITKPVVIGVKASLTQPWAKKTLETVVNVTVKKN